MIDVEPHTHEIGNTSLHDDSYGMIPHNSKSIPETHSLSTHLDKLAQGCIHFIGTEKAKTLN